MLSSFITSLIYYRNLRKLQYIQKSLLWQVSHTKNNNKPKPKRPQHGLLFSRQPSILSHTIENPP